MLAPHRQQRQHQHIRHQLQRRRRLQAPLLDLLGDREARVEEQRLLAVLEAIRKFRREPRRQQAVKDRGHHDEEREATGGLVALKDRAVI